MTVTVARAFIPKRFSLGKTKGVYTFEEPSFPLVDYEKDGEWWRMDIAFYAGFRSDGASTPFPFSLIVPGFKDGDDLYNLAPFLHDALYATKGGKIFSREECDDFLRGIWRISGMGRFVAGVADKCVEWFAGGKRDWGNDCYAAARFFQFHRIKM